MSGLFFPPSHLLCSSLFLSFLCLSPSLLYTWNIVVTQIRGHIAGYSPPSPLRFVLCISVARRFQLFLPSSTRVELCLPTLEALSAIDPFLFLFLYFVNKFQISPRRDSNSRTNTSSIRGLPLVHRSDRL